MPNPVVNRRLGGGASGSNPLLNGIISYWDFQTSSYLDLVDGNNLSAPNGGVTTQAEFIANGIQVSSGVGAVVGIADNASLSGGAGVSFTVSVWSNTASGTNGLLIGKWDKTHNDYAILINSQDRVVFVATDITTGLVVEVDSKFNVSGASSFNHFCAGFDATVGAIWLQINGGVRFYSSCSGVQRTVAAFTVGNFGLASAQTGLGAGLDEAAFWHRSLSADEVNLLYNMGIGNQYPFSGVVVTGSSLTVGQDWANRVVSNGGAAPSSTSINAANDFYSGLVTDGLAGIVVAANMFAPDNLIAAITPLIAQAGSDPWVNHNFVIGDLTVNGLVGDGSTKYLATGIIPGLADVFRLNAPLTSISAGLVGYTSVDNSGSQEELACYGANTQSEFGLATNFGGSSYLTCWKFVTSGTDDIVVTAPSPATGYFSGQRTASNAIAFYFANSGHAHSTLGSGTGNQTGSIETVQPLFAFAANNNGGGPANFTRKRLSFLAVTKGLTSAQDAKLFSRVQTLRTTLGGGFV
jgi:hypothetical protein